MKKILSTVSVITMTLMLAQCGSISSNNSSSSSSSSTTSTVTSNIQTVQNDMAPDSLNYTQNAAASVSAAKVGSSGNPCENAADLFDCQPILLQLYMQIAQGMVGAVRTIIDGVGTAMGTVADGSSGSATWGTTSVQYSKTTSTDYSILVLGTGSTPVGYVDVSSNVYTVKMDLSNIDDDGGNSGQIQATITYTDANTWSIVFFLTGMACSESDVAAPERIHIQVAKAGGLWIGKAMLYNPRWYGNGLTCSTTPTDGTSMNFYTDFVGDDTAAKAKVYMMQRNKSSLDDIASYGMDSIGSNFGGGSGVSAYANPFCNPAGTLDALWINDCTSRDAAVGAAAFGASTDWITPYNFYQLSITIPSSL